MKFLKLDQEKRKLLLEMLDVGTENLKCQYCKKKVDYKDCSILPTNSNKKKTIIACGSPLCLSTYLTEEDL